MENTPSVPHDQANPAPSTAERRVAFANWLVSPFRQPATQKELAELWGVAQSTLSDWKRTPEVQSVLREWRAPYQTVFVEAVDAIFKKAKAGDVSAFRALAEVLGENAPHKLDVTNRMTLAEYLSGFDSGKAGRN